MEQLKVKDITNMITRLRQSGMSLNEIKELPIYLGKDDELNGIHCGWYCQVVDSNAKDEDNRYLTEMINQDYANNELDGKGVLIS
jgi:DNA-binding transcriptional MerR regulator